MNLIEETSFLERKKIVPHNESMPTIRMQSREKSDDGDDDRLWARAENREEQRKGGDIRE